MKKVGILTFHYVDNYGAVLQTYALRSFLNSREDCEAEIINYVPADFTYKFHLYGRDENNVELLKEKRSRFERFLTENCGVVKPIVSEVSGNDYDYYCAGSDQIWNLMQLNGNTDFLFSNLAQDAVKVSYAASIGMGLSQAGIYKDVFKKYLQSFKAISLREEEQVAFVRELTGKDCQCVVDPTLLLGEADYRPIISKKKLREHPFIFFFWLPHDDKMVRGIDFVNTLSRKYGLPIVHNIIPAPPYMFQDEDGCMVYEGVEEFLWYIKNASFVVTNSYHATLFSMQFKTPFYIFLVESMRSRMDTIIKKYGIGDRVIDGYRSIKELNADIDFEYITKEIEKNRRESVDYLEDALDIKR